jgi:hypothetical protein
MGYLEGVPRGGLGRMDGMGPGWALALGMITGVRLIREA